MLVLCICVHSDTCIERKCMKFISDYFQEQSSHDVPVIDCSAAEEATLRW